MILDATLLHAQYYTVKIKGKWSKRDMLNVMVIVVKNQILAKAVYISLYIVAERKNFKLLFSAGITLAVEVLILFFHPMKMI